MVRHGMVTSVVVSLYPYAPLWDMVRHWQTTSWIWLGIWCCLRHISNEVVWSTRVNTEGENYTFF